MSLVGMGAPPLPPPPAKIDTSIPASIGIIVPPEKIQRIIHQTANFVAKQGRQVEEDILAKATEATANSFMFLLESSPFHAYYLQRVSDVLAGKEDAASSATAAAVTAGSTALASGAHASSTTPAASAAAPEEQPKVITKAPVMRSVGLAEAIRASAKRRGEAPRELQFLLQHPIDTPPLTIEIIKLTAQRVAVEGKRLESDLVHREQTNKTGELGFLLPTHELNEYYSELLASYRKILGRDSTAISQDEMLKQAGSNPMSMLDRVLQRLHHRREERAKIDPEAAKMKERQEYLEINWHDFVVVETINIDAAPAPVRTAAAESSFAATLAPSSAPAAQLDQERRSEAAAALRSAMTASAQDDADEGLNVRTEYAPAAVRAASSVPMMTLPDGRLVPVTEVNQHIKAELQDSRWRVTQDKFESRTRTTNTEHGAQISIALAKLAGARPDVFGGEEESALRRAEEKRLRERERVVWDGNAFTAQAAKAAVQLQAATHELVSQAKPVLYQKPSQLLPSSGAPVPLVPFFPPPVVPSVAPPPLPPPQPAEALEPDAKRARAEPPPPPPGASSTSGAGAVVVTVPAGGPNGLGPTSVELKLPDDGIEVQALKEQVSKSLQGVAVGRFQLMVDGRFLKNTDVVPKTCAALDLKWKSK